MTCVKHGWARGRRRRGMTDFVAGIASRKSKARLDWCTERERAYAYAMAEWPASALATGSHNMTLFAGDAQRERIAESVLRALRRDAALRGDGYAIYWHESVVLVRRHNDNWTWRAHTIDAVLGGGVVPTLDEAGVAAERFLTAYYGRRRRGARR